MQPGTCVVGYNSIRFDDEVTRNTLYRNFFDPYTREWQNGNSRWDIIDMVRLTRLLRPQGINWPDYPDGRASFKLEHLTQANGIEHSAAHDALSDVWATIAMAKLIRDRQPKLYEYLYRHRDKRSVAEQLRLRAQKPVLHISAKYPSSQGCGAVVVPVAQDKQNKNAVYVYDLSIDPQPLLTLPVDKARERVFTAAMDLPEGVERIPLKAVHLNKCPVVVPVGLVTSEIAGKMAIDLDLCRENLKRIRRSDGLAEKVADLFSHTFPQSGDPDLMIYSGGFFSDRDRRLMEQLRATEPERLREYPIADDARIPEMLFRYRARNYPETLSEAERQRWDDYRLARLTQPDGGGSITLSQYREEIAALRADPTLDENAQRILDQLSAYAETLI